MPLAYPAFKACPCGSGRSYAACCQPWHSGEAAPTPEHLMRSRYSAFVLRDAAYLLSTWHPDHRPDSLDLNDGTRYTRLTIHAAEGEEVEFTARLTLPNGQSHTFRERSRFTLVDGRWMYVDGVVRNSEKL